MVRRRWLSVLLMAAAMATISCKRRETHEHASDHPKGHDHHAEGHGHGETPMVRITRWSEELELFAEHPAAVAGKEVVFLAHLTVLKGFQPLEKAEVQLELSGPSALSAVALAPDRPGIFRLVLEPRQIGAYRGRLIVKGHVNSVIDGIELEVFEDDRKAAASVVGESDGRLIELLKEQQWGVPFATVFAGRGTVVASIEVAGAIDTPPGGSAEVGAPIAGRVVAPPQGLPRPGEAVRKGRVLASLAPAPSSPEEAARAGLRVTEAEARAGQARAALERAERLIRDEAISVRELEDARREVRVSEEGVRSAKKAENLFSGAAGSAVVGSWRLVSPIDGIVTDVKAAPGAAVSQGDVLFRVVDVSELWIRARVPEQDATRLRTDRDAAFQLTGLATWLPIDISGSDATASLVTVGRTVDPTSRTVDVIYALRKADSNLRVGGLVRVSLPAGDDFSGVVIPRSAIVDDDGREVVYVQVDGEHFEERVVRSGPRQGELAGVTQGLSGDERVVVTGANVVRLAAKAGAGEQPHGHIH